MDIDRALENAARAQERANAFITIAPRDAIARQAVGDKPLSRLLISVKDDLFTAGLRTTGGSVVYADFKPETDAPAVALLKRQGVAILGKTNLTEFAMSLDDGSPLAGACLHPLSPDHWAGASSGGAAAAAFFEAGDAAIATDSGGSARAPAALCGVACYNPTPDPALRTGSFGANRTLLSIGVLSRHIATAGRIGFWLRRQPESRHETTKRSEPNRRFGWLDLSRGRHAHDPEVHGFAKMIATNVLAGLGLSEHRGTIDLPDCGEMFAVISDYERLSEMTLAGTLEGARAEGFGTAARERLARAAMRTAQDVERAQTERVRFRAQIAKLFESVDFLVSPTVGFVAPELRVRAETVDPATHAANLAWVNLAELPAISLPIGSVRGFPVGLQLVARQYDDDALLRLAKDIESRLTPSP